MATAPWCIGNFFSAWVWRVVDIATGCWANTLWELGICHTVLIPTNVDIAEGRSYTLFKQYNVILHKHELCVIITLPLVFEGAEFSLFYSVSQLVGVSCNWSMGFSDVDDWNVLGILRFQHLRICLYIYIYIYIYFFFVVDLHLVMILGKWPNWRTTVFYVFISILYMFRATSCSSSVESIVG